MVSNDGFDGKATNLNCFYLHINFEQKYPKLAIVIYWIKKFYLKKVSVNLIFLFTFRPNQCLVLWLGNLFNLTINIGLNVKPKLIFFFLTPARTHSISWLKSRVLKLTFLALKMMVKSDLDVILKFTRPFRDTC